MNGAGFGSSYPETFQQQHRMRSMSWCEGGELKSSPSSLKADNIHIKQEEIMSAGAALIRADSAELQSCSTEVINLKKPSARKNAWGCLSYADLIAKAIESSPNQRLTLNQIYSWMVENVPYFRAKGQTNSSAGWKNSIRHNLSLHGRFVRVQNEGAGKSSWWMVNNNNRMQKTPRRRSTTMDSKSFEKKKKAVTLAKDSFSLKSSPLSASVPAYLGSCGQYQHQIYHQFPHQQPQTQPLDSFETAFRPVDRQHCGFQEKEHAFSIKSAGMLRYGDNCFNSNDMRSEIFEANALGNSRGSIGSPNDGQILFCSLQPITSITKQTEACQQFAQANYNMGTPLISQPACSALPDFFKLPDDAWRQYLPPSPNGLTETVISSESLTALLETGAESEIIDLVPPSLSTFDEEGNERKKETKDRCKFAQNDSSEKLLEAGDKCQSGAQRESGSCLVDQSSHLNAPLSPSFINQDKELSSTSVLRHVLTTVSEEDPENGEHLSDFPISSSAEQTFTSFVGEVQGLASKDHHQTTPGEFEVSFEDKNESFTLPYKMPLNADDGQTPAVIPAVPSFVLTGDVAMTSDATSQDERADESASSKIEHDASLAPALSHAATFTRF